MVKRSEKGASGARMNGKHQQQQQQETGNSDASFLLKMLGGSLTVLIPVGVAILMLSGDHGVVDAFFRFGGGGSSSNHEMFVKSDRFGCREWRGVDSCYAKSKHLDGTPGKEKSCSDPIGPRESGYCKCTWGETARVDCNHEPFTCQQMCYENFPVSVNGGENEDEQFLRNTEWNWNNWRHVEFLAGGEFLAPTPECQGQDPHSDGCFWSARNGHVFIMWGSSGLHVAKIDKQRKTLNGMRYDGDKCSAAFVKNIKRSSRQARDPYGYEDDYDEEDADDDEDDDHDHNGDEEQDDEEGDLYELLGLDYDANEAAIKKAFRKLSREYHPDRLINSDRDKDEAAKMFDKIRSAYEILGDPDKRILYDTGGMEAVKKFIEQGGREGNGQRHDMFGGFFGVQRDENRGQDFNFLFKVTLKDMYKGNEMKTKVKRRVVCRGCRKLTPKNKERCMKCGKCPPETRMVQRQMGGFIVQQQEQVPSKERCTEEPAELTVQIEKGMKDGDVITFARMSEQTPGKIPGDIILKLEQKDHGQFKRIENDLQTTVHISLKDALTGFTHKFKHLDDHLVELNVDSGQVIKPFQQQRMKNEGMPFHNVPSQFGDLIVEYEIDFPNSLSPEQKDKLRQILP